MSTIRLYRENVYLKETTGCITSKEATKKGTLVTLDRSLFFPEGGGQNADRGTIAGFSVLDVQEKEDQIYHLVDCTPDQLPDAGSDTQVLQLLDWDHRFDNMQRHCGEHIVSGIFAREYGGVNRGFHMGEDYMTIDISLEDDPDYD
ncbi:MAG: alanyl-tRNA editing protein, partial [Firmicutes bacterium]|nr:alanyl-tRNA editing protein [Bacillota bacterium]